jgi:hypothetical protein
VWEPQILKAGTESEGCPEQLLGTRLRNSILGRSPVPRVLYRGTEHCIGIPRDCDAEMLISGWPAGSGTESDMKWEWGFCRIQWEWGFAGYSGVVWGSAAGKDGRSTAWEAAAL